jgi:hyaluronate lyase
MQQVREALPALFHLVETGDGFYQDGSFLPHTSFPDSTPFGIGQLEWGLHSIYLLAGSPWQLTDSEIGPAERWIWQTFEPLLYGSRIFDDPVGPALARATGRGDATPLVTAALLCSRLTQGVQAVAYQQLVKQIVSTDPTFSYAEHTLFKVRLIKEIMENGAIAPLKTTPLYKQFPIMGRFVLRRNHFAFSAALSTDRISNPDEPVNTLNLQGSHFHDGRSILYDADYDQFGSDYWATVDPHRLPGITISRMEGISVERLAASPRAARFAGGATFDGIYGVSGMELQPAGQTLQAKKSWFMFDDEIVALGSAIASKGQRTVETIVDNRKLRADGTDNRFVVNGREQPAASGWSQKFAAVKWAFAEGNVPGSRIGYFFPSPSALQALRETRTVEGTGDAPSGSMVTKPKLTRSYLTLWLDHGVNPQGGRYAYVLLPTKEAQETEAYAASPDVKILRHDSLVHAVREKRLNIIAANFWQDGTHELDILRINRSAAVMWREQASQRIEIALSDPTLRDNGVIEVQLQRSATGYQASPQITVYQLKPTIRFRVSTKGAQGKTFTASFNLTD